MGISVNDTSGRSVPSGQPTKLRLDGAGALKTHDYHIAVGAGLIPGASVVLGFGNNGDIDSGANLPEDVWSGGGLYTWLAAATVLEAVSASANDAAAGTGMRTMLVSGLNAAYVETDITVTLNGLTPVSLVVPLLRINRIVAMTSGSLGTNVGDVVIRVPGPGATIGHMPAGFGSTRSSNFTVPAGKTLLLMTFTSSINKPSSARDASVVSFVRSSNGTYRLSNEVSVDGNPFSRQIIPAVPLPEKTDYILRCTYVSQDNTDLTAAWSGILRVND